MSSASFADDSSLPFADRSPEGLPLPNPKRSNGRDADRHAGHRPIHKQLDYQRRVPTTAMASAVTSIARVAMELCRLERILA
jgi:hypothetical protein